MNCNIPQFRTTGRTTGRLAIALIALLLIRPTDPVVAQDLTAQLIEPTEASKSFYGAAVAVHNDWAFVGAPFNADPGEDAGIVYVYRFNGVLWTRTQKLHPMGGPENSGWFGFSLALSDGLAAVGSPQTHRSGDRSGAVCIFRLQGDEWIRESHLTAPDASPDMAFGAAVAIDGDHVLIGASSDSRNGPRSGSAFVFRREPTGWEFEARLTPESSRALDAFGKAVALDGGRALIGAPWTRQGDVDAGSAFIFESNGSTWRQTAHLTATEGASGDMLGESVSLFGDVAAVGASRADETESGAVYVYRQSGESWVQESRLTAPDPAPELMFGASVSIRNDVLLVGAPFFREGQAPGAVYRFDRDGRDWTMTAEIRSPAAEEANHLGQSVCLSGTHMIAGAFREQAYPGTTGCALIYSVPDVGPLGSTRMYPW